MYDDLDAEPHRSLRKSRRLILGTRDGGWVLDLDDRDRVGDTHPAESGRQDFRERDILDLSMLFRRLGP